MLQKSIIALCAAFLFSSCSRESAPSESTGSAVLGGGLTKHMEQLREGVALFNMNFHKVDGQELVINGAKGYKMFFTAQISFPEGYRSDCLAPRSTLCYLYAGLSPALPGTVRSYSGSIDFTRSENGWIVQTLNIDFGKPIGEVVAPPAPPSTAERAAFQDQERRRVQDTIRDCLVTIPGSATKEVKHPKYSIDPVKNKVSIDIAGKLYWNGSVTDIAKLKQYLSSTQHMNPEPVLQVEFNPEIDQEKVYQLYEAVVSSGACNTD